MNKISKSNCESCGKDVWDGWNSCPGCGTLLSAGKSRTSIPPHSFRK